MSDNLTQVSEELADTVASAGRSVVRVEGRRRIAASGIAWSQDGLIVTADHVVEDDENIKIGLPDGETASAALVGRDPATDLAVLRVDGAGLSQAEWSEPESARVGNLALALGRPGNSVQATMGIVSAIGDGWRTQAGGQIDRYLQADLTMYPGFSGGPLVDSSGKVLGLNSSALLRGVSVSVPAPTIRRTVDTLLKHGRVRRGYLGVGAQVARLPEELSKQQGQETGLLLVSVEPDSPAHGAGLVLGDTIVALAGEPMRHLDDLLAALGGHPVGEAVTVKIVRGGSIQEMSVTVGERPKGEQSENDFGGHRRRHGGHRGRRAR
jgi:S1-C subfamily serine protease